MNELNKIKRLKKLFLNDAFKTEHFDASIEILEIMASCKPNTNHIILDALCQVGKTSVMELVYRLLNYKQLYAKYGINNVIYLTADNGSGDGSLKLQSKSRFEKHWKNYEHTLPIRFLKRSDLNKYANSICDTLIMVDESQYGWREIESMCQRFLQRNGVNFTSGSCLCKNNTYILSVSATTQNERYGDSEFNLKPLVTLKPGKGYIGVKDFIEMGAIKPLMTCDFVDNYEKLDKFLRKQAKKLKKIYKNTNVSKCVIMRLFDNKKSGFLTDSDEFESIVEDNGFTYELITCRDSKIDYIALQNSIYYNCTHYVDNGKKFHLVVIKNAFSYGITIKPEIKKLIGTCYDVRKDCYSTEATEQGTLGRMCGYGCKKKDFERLEFYINISHFNGIKANKVYNANEFSTPIKSIEEIKKIECNYKEWDGDLKHIAIFYDKKNVFEGKDVDKFFKKHDEFDYDSLFNPNKTTNETVRKPFIKNILETFFDEKNIDDYSFIYDKRRITSESEEQINIIDSNFVVIHEKAITRQYKKIIETAMNNEKVLSAYVDVRNADCKTKKGIKIIVRYGHVNFVKEAPVIVEKTVKRKLYSGYDTSVNNVKLSPICV